jgi:hypothetical protein
MNLSKALHEGPNYLEYKAWHSMCQRCTKPDNPRFADYGGRGIQVSDRWLHGEGPRHPSIMRSSIITA